MTNSLARRELTEKQVEVLRSQVAPGCSDEEMQLFLAVCSNTGLDPFQKQVYCIKTQGRRVVIHIGIDGLRLIAERSGQWRGSLGPWWCGPDGKWVDVWLDREPPAAAKFVVHKDGFDHPVTAVVTWRACAQPNSQSWQRDAPGMLGKCAEALAIRRAFPHETQGVAAAPELAAEGVRVDVETGEMLDPPRQLASPTIPHPQVQRTQAALEHAGKLAQTVIDVPPYPGAEAARCSGSECRRALTAGQWLFSHKARGRPLCPTCQKAAAKDRVEDVVGVASDELEMEVDPGGGVPREEREGEDEIPPAFR